MKGGENGWMTIKNHTIFLFNSITDMVQELENTVISSEDAAQRETLERCVLALRQLQLDAEEMYLSEM